MPSAIKRERERDRQKERAMHHSSFCFFVVASLAMLLRFFHWIVIRQGEDW